MRTSGVSASAEVTPLLLDSRSPPAVSSLDKSVHRSSTRRVTHSKGSQRFRHSQVHPLHNETSPLHEFSSAPACSRQLRSIKSSSLPRTQLTPNKIWQIIVSLPNRLLCFTSPTCPPLGFCCCITCIRSSQYGVRQRFGKFDRFLYPGIHVMKWPMEREAGRISMRIKQLDIISETKSKDHVILRIHVSIQYQTNASHLFESFYSLSSPTRLLTTHTHDVVRSTLPQLELDDIFSSQDSIALDLYRSLNGQMNQYGFIIHHALLTQIQPSERVKVSLNEMEASRRMRMAMPQKADAVKMPVFRCPHRFARFSASSILA